MAKKKVTHSAKYSLVKWYYDHDNWTIAQVHKAVQKGWITAEEYKEITGEDYEPVA